MIIDGKQISQALKDEMKEEVARLKAQYGRCPRLEVIIVGNNPASRSYVRGKIKATEYCGFDGELIELPEDVQESVLLSEIDRLTATTVWTEYSYNCPSRIILTNRR